jgi:hypothetical protein
LALRLVRLKLINCVINNFSIMAGGEALTI